MSVHCTLEALSTYVDAELPESDQLAIESHIEECDACRIRLDRLQGVVGQLHRLERVAAPPTLGWQVQRRVRLESGKVPLTRTLEDRLARLLGQPLMAPLFAVIIAFGAILYLFSLGVARQTVSGTQVFIGGAESSVLTLGDREFELVKSVWIEVGIGEESVEERIDLGAGGILPIQLEELRARSGTYRLRFDGRVVEVVIPDRTTQ